MFVWICYLEFYFALTWFCIYLKAAIFAKSTCMCAFSRHVHGVGGSTPPLDPKNFFPLFFLGGGLNFFGGNPPPPPPGTEDPFFVWLLREVGDVWWVPLLQVWKFDQTILTPPLSELFQACGEKKSVGVPPPPPPPSTFFRPGATYVNPSSPLKKSCIRHWHLQSLSL